MRVVNIALGLLVAMFAFAFVMAIGVGKRAETVVFGGLATGLLACFQLEFTRRANVTVFGLAVLVALYSAEGFFRLLDSRRVRSVLEVMRMQENEILRLVHPKMLYSDKVALRQDTGEVIPILTSISNSTFIACNENGYWPLYQTDEYGFNNPPGLHRQGVDAVLLGDSFVFGICVREEDTIASWLRRKGLTVLNLAHSGNGPLIKMGVVLEYAVALKPQTVFWFYYEGNDLHNLESEKKSGLFDDYLSGESHNNLTAIQPYIDKVLLQYPGNVVKRDTETNLARNITRNIPKWMKLYKVRNRLLKLRSTFPDRDEDVFRELSPDLKHILSMVKSKVGDWGGSLYFVYLPAWHRYRFKENDDFLNRKEVLNLVSKLDIPIIDIHKVFSNTSDPLDLFPSRWGKGHYNPQGYMLVANQISRRLNESAQDAK